MALKTASSSGIVGTSTLETSQAGLPSVVSYIEAELYSSDVYCQVVAVLQAMLGEAAAQAQILIKAVASEAIELASKHFAQQSESAASADAVQKSAAPAVCDPPASVAREAANPQPVEPSRKSKKPAQAELAASWAQQRETRLRELGAQLRQARLAQSVSLEELRDFTQVPLHAIQALENGRTASLPEDVYVRGFIRRIGNALGLEGDRLAASLPAPDPAKSVVPSWYRPETPAGLSLSPVHLYVGYAALMAGAVGGVHWLSAQSSPKPELSPVQTIPSPTSDVKSKVSAAPKTGAIAPLEIAPPEEVHF